MKRCTLAACLAVALTVMLTTPALADTASVSFVDAAGKSDPVADVGRTWTLSGNSSAPRRIYTKVRAPGGAPCAPSYSSDSGSPGDSPWSRSVPFRDTSVNGDFTFQQTGVWGTPGTYMFCYWIADSESQPVTPIRQDITFRASTGVISGTVGPPGLIPGQTATVAITGSSEAPKSVFAAIRTAGGAPCAATYDADPGVGLGDRSSGTSVNGAFALQATTTPDKPGTYLVCLWLADSSSDSTPVAGPQPVTFNVLDPTPPMPPPIPTFYAAKLELARATVLRSARRLSVLAPITGRASGTARGAFYAAGQTGRFDVPVDAANRRLRINRGIPASQARLGTGILTLTYPGDADTQPQEVRLRAASRHADLRAGRPRIDDGRLIASGSISRRARGVVRLQLLYEPAGQPTQTLEFTAPISDGSYSFNQSLSSEVLAGITGRRGVVHSYTLFTGYFQNRVRGEMRSFQVLP